MVLPWYSPWYDLVGELNAILSGFSLIKYWYFLGIHMGVLK